MLKELLMDRMCVRERDWGIERDGGDMQIVNKCEGSKMINGRRWREENEVFSRKRLIVSHNIRVCVN